MHLGVMGLVHLVGAPSNRVHIRETLREFGGWNTCSRVPGDHEQSNDTAWVWYGGTRGKGGKARQGKARRGM